MEWNHLYIGTHLPFPWPRVLLPRNNPGSAHIPHEAWSRFCPASRGNAPFCKPLWLKHCSTKERIHAGADREHERLDAKCSTASPGRLGRTREGLFTGLESPRFPSLQPSRWGGGAGWYCWRWAAPIGRLWWVHAPPSGRWGAPRGPWVRGVSVAQGKHEFLTPWFLCRWQSFCSAPFLTLYLLGCIILYFSYHFPCSPKLVAYVFVLLIHKSQ